MNLFDLATQSPQFKANLDALMASDASTHHLYEWFDGYLIALRETQAITMDEYMLMLSQLALSAATQQQVVH